jgi:hypothetical protein
VNRETEIVIFNELDKMRRQGDHERALAAARKRAFLWGVLTGIVLVVLV